MCELISIGSLGKHNPHEIVEEVYVRNCSFIDTTNGARIKTFPVSNYYYSLWWKITIYDHIC